MSMSVVHGAAIQPFMFLMHLSDAGMCKMQNTTPKRRRGPNVKLLEQGDNAHPSLIALQKTNSRQDAPPFALARCERALRITSLPSS